MVKVKDLIGKYGEREVDEAEFEKLLKPTKVKTIYDLELGEEYWFISESGKIKNTVWNNDIADRIWLELGNVFLTCKAAHIELERRKVEAELKRYASMCEAKIEGGNTNQIKYSLYAYEKEVLIDHTRYITGDIQFTDRNVLLQAINEIGKERIIKYYLGENI